MVSEQFDRCHGTLLQYVEFLGSAVTPSSNYGILIPSLNDLVHLYHLDPEVFVSPLPLPYYELPTCSNDSCYIFLSAILSWFSLYLHRLCYVVVCLNLYLMPFFPPGLGCFLDISSHNEAFQVSKKS